MRFPKAFLDVSAKRIQNYLLHMRSQSKSKISPAEVAPPIVPVASSPPEAPSAQISPVEVPTPPPAPSSSPKPHENTTAYLKKLLQRHTAKADFVQSFTSVKEQYFEEEIISGRYNIYKRDWSAEEERMKASRGDHRNTAEMLHAKRQLEDDLQLIQGAIEDGERGSKGMSDEQRKAFLKRMEKEKKELLRKKEESNKFVEQRRIQEQTKEKEQLQREQAQRRIKKQQEIAERLRALQQTRKKKQEQYRSQTALLKEKMKQKTTATKIEQNYNLKQNQNLEQRKRRLAEIRTLHKPIDRKELDAHAEKLEKFHAQRMAALAAESEKAAEKPPNFYKSIFYKKVKEEPKFFLDRQSEQQVGKLRQNRDRLKKFSEHIRQNYKPAIDQKKVEQLRFRRANRSMSNVNPKENDPQKLGLRYLQYAKQQVENQRLLGSGSHRELTEQEDKPKKLDYLAQLRKANKNRVSESAHDLLSKLEKTSVSKEEKMKKILQFTDRIEKTAKRKQQLNKIGSGGVDDELDALYLEAIEAKLGLLQDY